MARIAFIKNGETINVIEAEDVNQIPDWGIIGVDENGNPIKKSDCDLHLETNNGSRNDLYEHEVGFYRQHDLDVESIDHIANTTDIEEI